MADDKEETENKNFYRDFFTWIVGILFVASAIFLFRWVYSGAMPQGVRTIYKEHFAAVVGLPSVAFFFAPSLFCY